MSVPLSGTGGLFTRWGSLFSFGKAVAAHQNAIDTRVDTILDQYEDDRELAVSLQNQLAGFKNSAGSPHSAVRTVAQATVVDMVNADDPQITRDATNALRVLIDQMTASGDDIDGMTVTATPAADGGNTGTGSLKVWVRNKDGIDFQNIRPEVIDVTCTSDAQISGTAGQETFSVKGEASVSTLDPTWPQGSGISGSMVVTNAATDAGSGVGQNMLTNGDFEDTSAANTFSTWEVVVGTIGTTILEVATSLRGSKALRIAGNGAQLTSIRQQITNTNLLPNTKYVLGFWLRHDGTPPAAGVLRASVQTAAGAILGTSNVSVTLSGVTGAYALYVADFATTNIIPATNYLVIELTTALTNGRSIYIDEAVMLQPYQFGGAGGPYMAMFAGGTNFLLDDLFTVTMANNWTSADLAFQIDRYLDTYAKGLTIPYDTGGAETLPDPTYIT